MCTVFLSFTEQPYRLFVIANRDEFHDRPTQSAHFWHQHPDIFGGKDLRHQGTWFAWHQKTNKWGLITNYRESPPATTTLRSRGAILRDYLTTKANIEDFLNALTKKSQQYLGFNCLLGQKYKKKMHIYYYSNRQQQPRRLNSGIYGLSNHLLDSPWPKVVDGKKQITNLFDNYKSSPSPIDNNHYDRLADQAFTIMENKAMASNERLPDTGVGPHLEKILSALFIQDKDRNYGTRSCALLIDTNNSTSGHTLFYEKCYNHRGRRIKCLQIDMLAAYRSKNKQKTDS